MALALANDGRLMVAHSQTSPRQQVLFYDIANPRHKLADLRGLWRDCQRHAWISDAKQILGIRGVGMDAAGNIYVAMSEMGSCLRKFSP